MFAAANGRGQKYFDAQIDRPSSRGGGGKPLHLRKLAWNPNHHTSPLQASVAVGGLYALKTPSRLFPAGLALDLCER